MKMTNDIEKRLWAAADQLWANSSLKPSEFSAPVLGLIFLRYADHKFSLAETEFSKTRALSGHHKIGKIDYQAKGVLYLPNDARFSKLRTIPEGQDVGKAINDAMKLVETENEELRDILPKTYKRLDNATLIELLRILGSIPMGIEGDAFGKIYEYFLGNFAMKEGQKGGVFYTPTSIVKLIVEVIEPFHGRIYDPACGSGGMFVQSARFVENHKKDPNAEIAIYGQEKVADTIRLCKMNLAVHGVSGDIREANTYYEDLHESLGKFDFVMANPPFNVSGVDKERIKGDRRFRLGIPRTDNANYIWIQAFYSALNDNGRAGFVMASSAGDARGAELDVRKKLIQSGVADVMISVGSNFFYTVTLPCALWFLDKGKPSARRDKVLFLDARGIYRQVDRAHRDFSAEQIEFLANIVRLYRGEKIESSMGSGKRTMEHFGKNPNTYADVPGLCKVATIRDIEGQGWSLNPGRYVGVNGKAVEDSDLREKLEELNEELETLNVEARQLGQRVSENIAGLLGEI